MTKSTLVLLGLTVSAILALGGCGDSTPGPYTVTYTATLTGATTFDEIAWDDGNGGTQVVTNANPNWSTTLKVNSGGKMGIRATATSTDCTIVVTAKADDGKGNIVDRNNTQTGKSNIPRAWTSETDHPTLP
jgi:hypothetical protein